MFNKKENEGRFYIKQTESLSKYGDLFIIVDRETGIHYISTAVGMGNGLTPLLDSEGNPVRE